MCIGQRKEIVEQRLQKEFRFSKKVRRISNSFIGSGELFKENLEQSMDLHAMLISQTKLHMI